MDSEIILIIVIATALAFDFTNGFHDTANVVATSISTGAARPQVAIGFASLLNFVGAFISISVAATVAKDVVDAEVITPTIVFAGLIGAIAWNLITWDFVLPSSSSHALIGGLVGAALASSATVKWHVIVKKVVIPMVLSPLVGLVLAFIVMLALLWIFRRRNPSHVNRGFKYGQWVSSAAMSYGHGLQDAQKTMGVLTLALVVTHHLGAFVVPLWVKLACAAAIALGTYSGGWRIMRTLGRRVFKLDNAAGFAAQSVASSVLMTTAYVYAAPISTTHVITSSVMGVGATRKLSAVRWGVAGNILAAWILTLPMAALVAAAVFKLTHV